MKFWVGLVLAIVIIVPVSLLFSYYFELPISAILTAITGLYIGLTISIFIKNKE